GPSRRSWSRLGALGERESFFPRPTMPPAWACRRPPCPWLQGGQKRSEFITSSAVCDLEAGMKRLEMKRPGVIVFFCLRAVVWSREEGRTQEPRKIYLSRLITYQWRGNWTGGRAA